MPLADRAVRTRSTAAGESVPSHACRLAAPGMRPPSLARVSKLTTAPCAPSTGTAGTCWVRVIVVGMPLMPEAWNCWGVPPGGIGPERIAGTRVGTSA